MLLGMATPLGLGNFNDIFPGNYGSISTGTAGLMGFRDGVTPIRTFGRTAAPVGFGSVVTWDEGFGCKIWRVVTRKTSTNFSVFVAVKAAKVLPFLPEMFGVNARANKRTNLLLLVPG